MKSIFSSLGLLVLTVMFSSVSFARDYGDKDCNIFVIQAGNVITGGFGNYLSAKVAVSKSLIQRDFKKFQVRILGSENISPSKIEDSGKFMIFVFDKYAKGIEYRGNSASVVAFISNGIDRLFDNNDNVLLVQKHNWQYTNPRCE